MTRLLSFIFLILLPMLAEARQDIISTAGLAEQVSRGEVMDAKVDGKGHVWIATLNGLLRKDDAGIRLIPLPSLTHHPFPAIHCLAVDSIAQRLWIGAWNHIYCYNLKDERFVTISDSTVYQTVRMDTAPGGGVMAYTQHGLFRIILEDSLTKGRAEQINFSVYGKPEPLTLDRINALTGLGMSTPSHIPYFIRKFLCRFWLLRLLLIHFFIFSEAMTQKERALTVGQVRGW